MSIVRDIIESKRADTDLAPVDRNLAAELAGMNDLHRISTIFIENGDESAILNEIVQVAIAITHADMGNIQLLDIESGRLNIVAHRGFEQPFLDFFAFVKIGYSPCAMALKQSKRVIIEDVTKNPFLVDTPELHALLDAGVRAVQSTPLVARSGTMQGMLSTHYRSPHIPEKHDLKLLDLLARYAADIIERKRAEDTLRQSEERFCKAFHSNPCQMAIISLADQRYIAVNQRWLNSVGLAREEVIGRPVGDVGVFSKAQLQKLLDVDYGKVEDQEFVYFNKKGQRRYGLRSSDIITINGERCLLGAAMDITDRKNYEREIGRLDRLNLVGEVAASIAHEIRNPMTVVKGFLQILQGKEEFAPHQDRFSTMIEELDRANAIITEFLSLARTAPSDLKIQSLDVIVTALLPLVQADAMKYGIKVSTSLENTPQIMLDEKQIRQLVLNLARNGIEAMSENGELTILTRRKRDRVLLIIKDRGKGIPQEVLEKLGTPFLTLKQGGTGLGMPVCQRIAQSHNAKIEIRTGDRGTIITVSFPIPLSQVEVEST